MSKYTAPQFEASALITMDTQRDFLDGQPFEIPGTSAVLPVMARLLKLFRELGRPIVHIVRIYREDGQNVDLCRRELVEDGFRIVAPGSPGMNLPAELAPDPNTLLDGDFLLEGGIQKIGADEVVIYKPRWGAFYRTPLEEHLRSLGITTLVFSGCNYPNCPRTSIYEAGERDFRLVLVKDAISGLYPKGEEEMTNIGVYLMTADELETAIRDQAA